MQKEKHLYPYLFILLATVLIGMSGGIAKFMDLYPPFVIWARCLFGLITLYIIHFFTTKSWPTLPLKNKNIVLTGFLMCTHWVLFFYSIQVSTVAIAIVAVFTYPLQTIFLESFFSKKAIDRSYFVSSIFVVVGVYLLSPNFSLANQQTWGLLLGLLSALALSLRNIFSRTLMEQYSANTVHISQVLVSGIILLPFAFSESPQKITENIIPLVSLGIFTTAIGHLLLMKSLQFFTAGEVGLLNGAQPVAAIIIAYFLVGEIPTPAIISGAIIILAAVLFAVWNISKTK